MSSRCFRAITYAKAKLEIKNNNVKRTKLFTIKLPVCKFVMKYRPMVTLPLYSTCRRRSGILKPYLLKSLRFFLLAFGMYHLETFKELKRL